MFKIKDIKKKALSFFKKNKWTLIMSTIITTFIVGETTLASISFNNLELTYSAFKSYNEYKQEEEKGNETDPAASTVKQYSSNIVSQILNGDTDSFITEYNEKNNVTKGIFFDVFSFLSKSRIQITQYVSNLINTEGNFLAVTIAISFMAIISILIKILLTNPLLIGQARLFLESIYYPKTRLRTIASVFRSKSYANSVKIILLRNVYQFLWNITIIGGFIKSYSYKMVPFIAAENGKICSKKAIRMSREMMDGHKFEAFKIDLSFLGWNLLVILTFGLAGLFVTPYYLSVMSKYYEKLRKEYIEKKKICYEDLSDEILFNNTDNRQTYSSAKTQEEKRKKAQEEYEEINSKYDWWDYVVFFFIFACLGWLWEVFYFTLEFGVIVNRGALYGPWLPIYGFGCSFIILIFSKLKRLSKLQVNPLKTFFLVMLICTFMEYMTSFVMEKLTGTRYWEYKGIFLNLNGRVCLENSIFFGVGGCLSIYLIGPILQRGVHKISKKSKQVICTILCTLCMLDAIYTVFHPHTGEFITEPTTNSEPETYFTSQIEEETINKDE